MLSSANILCSWVSLELACFRLVAIYFLFARLVVVLSYVGSLDCWVGVVWVIRRLCVRWYRQCCFSKFNPAVANRPDAAVRGHDCIAWYHRYGTAVGAQRGEPSINRAKPHLRQWYLKSEIEHICCRSVVETVLIPLVWETTTCFWSVFDDCDQHWQVTLYLMGCLF